MMGRRKELAGSTELLRQLEETLQVLDTELSELSRNR
jgi:hypothetical protein